MIWDGTCNHCGSYVRLKYEQTHGSMRKDRWAHCPVCDKNGTGQEMAVTLDENTAGPGQ